ncbi:molecular chaperone HtpG [Clostridium aminobutyricum]|uniref:Chaperone protein HtpG n=1 Tax=Clostridium aminobutyricum TaxID=33953 RepID=A0A939DAV0_CLOAM|nr:molecular chaperone HtpG [Clostridium aminobutyricum]MBN7774351.1 molecular chaperone HtpG [Clostridium aminobutyricum]
MAKKQFKAESKRLLDLMINSIYTHKEIFLREIISNASDAIDKLYYLTLTENTGISREDFFIRITLDKDANTIIISDNGIGMNKDEMENNLGTIAKSGSLQFKNENADKMDAKDAIDIIGQFGVGFYSAFMVSSKIQVISKRYGEETANLWESTGADGYSIAPCEKDSVGTEIILYLKDDTEDEKYSDYLKEYKIKGLIKKYSDYIRYPIKMNVEKHRMKEATEEQKADENFTPEYESYREDEVLNSMVPIWKKSKGDITNEDYNQFYKEKFFDFEDPARVIHTNVEGVSTYNSLLYIPARAPFNYYTREYEKGLQLYSSGVLIMDKCADLLPDHFSFVKGLVDSQDLSLNISREMLQHDRQLKAIAVRLEKKIKSELLEMLNTDREKYEKFFENFGLQLKFGAYNGYGQNKDAVQELLLFYSSSEKKLVTLSEYVSRMKEDQKYIYYACGESIDKLDKMPQTELLKDKGYEILYCTDEVDEFAIKMLGTIEEKQFKSVSSEDLGIEESSEEKEAAEKQKEENKELLEAMKEALGDKVSEVRVSQRLKSHPVCLASAGDLSIEMEKVLNAMPNASEKISAEKVLEINANHNVFQALKEAFAGDKEKVKVYAELLYNQALLIEGLSIEDPIEFSNAICSLM